MTDKTQPTAHAEITAPISADLRGIERTSPVSQAVRLLREAAAELKNCHTIGGDWGDEIEALDAYNEHMAVAATLEQAEAGQAVPAPVTYMATDNACKWAWDQVREEVGTEGWTAGDSCTFYGFFLWGWNYRGQYETQRPAAPPAPAAVAVTEAMVKSLLDAQDEYWREADTEPRAKPCNWRNGMDYEAARIGLEAALFAPAQAVAVPDGFGTAEHWKEKAQYWADVAHRLRGEALRGEPVDGIVHPAQEHATQLAGQGQEEARDAARLDYLQEQGATVELVFGGEGCSFRFRVGGLYAAAHQDLRDAIDAAMAAGGAT